MAKIIPMELIRSMSGKVCSHSDMYFSKRYGATYTGKICNPRTNPYSQSELDHQNRFKAVTVAVAEHMANTSTLEADRAAFMAQKNQKNGYKTLRGFLFAKGYANATFNEDNSTWSVTF